VGPRSDVNYLDKTTLLTLSGIEQGFLGRPARGLVTTPTLGFLQVAMRMYMCFQQNGPARYRVLAAADSMFRDR
jgi:hypothetical protein